MGTGDVNYNGADDVIVEAPDRSRWTVYRVAGSDPGGWGPLIDIGSGIHVPVAAVRGDVRPWHPGPGGSYPSAPAGEVAVVFLVDPEKLSYVRQRTVTHPHRTGRPAGRYAYGGQLVGWTELDPSTPSVGWGRHERRVLWLCDHDRDAQPGGPYRVGAPAEAVDPRTIAPGMAGAVTARAWGRSL